MSFPEHPGEKVGCVQVPAQERGGPVAPCPTQPHRELVGKVWEVFTRSVTGITFDESK